MTEVTDVIVARRARPEPFNAMLVWSLVFHASLVGLLLFGPFDWRVEAEAPRSVMTISLAAGPVGPRTGITTEGGRAIPPPPPEAVPKAMPPPPPKPVEKVVPTQTRRTPPAKPKVEEEPQPGVTRTDTGTRGQGFGLSAGGSGGSGVQLDVANFCCPEYIQQMVTLIQRNWQQNQGIRGSTVMYFIINRGGTIQGVKVERPSGFLALDLAAERALLITRLPELPPQFPNPTLPVHITFEYQR
jgi:TonB family protein